MMPSDLDDALAGSRKLASDPEGSPIYHALQKEQPYSSPLLHLEMECPEECEALYTRVFQKDVAKGNIDPDNLLDGRMRDYLRCEVTVPRVAAVNGIAVGANSGGGGGSADGLTAAEPHALSHHHRLTLRLPAFMAHLATPLGLVDPSHDDEAIGPLWDDGTWTGTLMWDSAVHATELLLASADWRQRLAGTSGGGGGSPGVRPRRPASVVELGCGLGLPGLTCHLLGASPVILTDRGMVADLCRDAVALHPDVLSGVRAVPLEWSAEGAAAFRHEHLGGAPPDVVLACDCIFAPLFGDAYLLLEMLLHLCRDGSGAGQGADGGGAGGGSTVALLALERRTDDGAEGFFMQAVAAGFSVRLCARHGRVLICEMEWRRSVESSSESLRDTSS